MHSQMAKTTTKAQHAQGIKYKRSSQQDTGGWHLLYQGHYGLEAGLELNVKDLSSRELTCQVSGKLYTSGMYMPG